MVTYLHFYLSYEEPSPSVIEILRLSLSSTVRDRTRKTIFITNIKERLLSDGNLEQIYYEDILSIESKNYLSKLDKAFLEKKIVANYPPIERLCFLRWLVFRDLSRSSVSSKTYIHTDWDNVIFSFPKLETERKSIGDVVMNLNVSDLLKHPHEAHPAYCIVNSKSLENFGTQAEKLLNTYSEQIGNKRKNEYFNDKVIWGKLLAKQLRNLPQCRFRMSEIYSTEEFRVCRNIRLLNDDNESFKSTSYYVDPTVNYSGKEAFEIVSTEFTDNAVYGETKENRFKWTNLDYQGTEGKYIMLRYHLNELKKIIGM